MFIYTYGLVVLPEDKMSRLLMWCDRLRQLGKVKRKEVEAFNGTVNFCSIVCRKARTHLSRLYRATTATFSNRYQAGGYIRMTKGIKADVRRIAELFISSGGISCFPSEGWTQPGRRDHGFYQTDACRNDKDLLAWSGMGGFFAGKFWWIRLTQEQVKLLPVHITEAVANLINADVFGTKTAGGKITEECDNASVVDAFNTASEGGQPHDPRLQELARLKEAITTKHNTLTRLTYIATKDNVLADQLSRGAFREFFESARELGFACDESDRVAVPQRFKSLLRLLCNMTSEMSA